MMYAMLSSSWFSWDYISSVETSLAKMESHTFCTEGNRSTNCAKADLHYMN
jgi:hypothetical protein